MRFADMRCHRADAIRKCKNAAAPVLLADENRRRAGAAESESRPHSSGGFLPLSMALPPALPAASAGAAGQRTQSNMFSTSM